MRRFEIELCGTVTLELEDAVINAVNDKWRSVFYDLFTPGQIAEHIAYNLVVNHVPLSMLDGWADQPDKNARVVEKRDWELEAEEEKNA